MLLLLGSSATIARLLCCYCKSFGAIDDVYPTPDDAGAEPKIAILILFLILVLSLLLVLLLVSVLSVLLFFPCLFLTPGNLRKPTAPENDADLVCCLLLCDVLWCYVLWCDVLWYDVLWCDCVTILGDPRASPILPM